MDSENPSDGTPPPFWSGQRPKNETRVECACRIGRDFLDFLDAVALHAGNVRQVFNEIDEGFFLHKNLHIVDEVMEQLLARTTDVRPGIEQFVREAEQPGSGGGHTALAGIESFSQHIPGIVGQVERVQQWLTRCRADIEQYQLLGPAIDRPLCETWLEAVIPATEGLGNEAAAMKAALALNSEAPGR